MKFSLLRFTNMVILGAMTALGISGVYGLYWTMPGWMFHVHRIAAWTLVAAIPWKIAVSWRSLRRGLKADVDRGVMVFISVLISIVTLLIMALGYAWQWRLGPDDYFRRSVVSWHWILGLGLILPFLIHSLWRWPRPRKADFTSRRAALKLLGLGAASLAGWWLADAFASERDEENAARHISGSRLDGFYSGNQFPITHTISAKPEQTDLSIWRLELTGKVERPKIFTYDELLTIPSRNKDATLDCTLGWYTIQAWSGIALDEFITAHGLDPSAEWVSFRSVTGYEHPLPMKEARAVLLATHVGGEPLSFVHGAPLRVVVPSRRGWFWVKWLTRIEVG
jgi:hypothetical protein